MFGKKQGGTTTTKVVTTVELSDETRQALVGLENDIQVLAEFMQDMQASATAILAALQGSVIAETAKAGEVEEEEEVPFRRSGSGLGVRAFAGDPPPIVVPGETKERETPLPSNRQRNSPFNRVPRAEQEAWLRGYMKENPGWIHPHVVAREFAGDEREMRYLRSAISRTLKELYTQGVVEREDATERGSMYRFRLKK